MFWQQPWQSPRLDVRRSSATFGKWISVDLSAANKKMFWVPRGFAHGFLTLEDGTDFLYKCDAPYAPGHERVLAWDDPEIGIDWPLQGLAPRLSQRDLKGSALSAIEAFA